MVSLCQVRRMAGQLLPAITELLCWFSMGRLRELWQTLLRPDLLGKLRPGAAPAVSCELLAFAAGLSLRHALRKAEVSLGLPYCGTHLGKSLYKDTLNLVMQHRCRHPGRKVARSAPPLHTRFTAPPGAAISEAATRPNATGLPGAAAVAGRAGGRGGARAGGDPRRRRRGPRRAPRAAAAAADAGGRGASTSRA